VIYLGFLLRGRIHFRVPQGPRNAARLTAKVSANK
jgi:hypothetical protein